MQLEDKNVASLQMKMNNNNKKTPASFPALKTITKLLKYFLNMFVFFLSDIEFSS